LELWSVGFKNLNKEWKIPSRCNQQLLVLTVVLRKKKKCLQMLANTSTSVQPVKPY